VMLFLNWCISNCKFLIPLSTLSTSIHAPPSPLPSATTASAPSGAPDPLRLLVDHKIFTLSPQRVFYTRDLDATLPPHFLARSTRKDLYGS
jgi:hypothetical protein